MRGGVGDAEIDRQDVEERRFRQRRAGVAEISGSAETQAVAADAQRVAFEQRCRGASVVVAGFDACNGRRVAAGIEPMEFDPEPACWKP